MSTSANAPVALLVQPNDDGVLMYREYLNHNGIAPIAVSNVRDALPLASKADIIITGILLDGDVDGVELVSRLRVDTATKHKPIIVLTACALPGERERAERAGCDVFLPKPCLPAELLRQVRTLLAASKLSHVRGSSAKADLPQTAERNRSNRST